MGVDALLIETAGRLLRDVCSFEAVEAAEEAGWADAIWGPLAEAGFCWIGLPEASGGSGGSLEDACAVLRVAGAHAAPVPLAETALLGGWLLSASGGTLPDGPLSVGTGPLTLQDGTVSGRSTHVPWGGRVTQVVALARAEPDGGSKVVAVDPSGPGVRIEPASNLAGEPRDTLHLERAAPVQVLDPGPGVDARSLRLRGALATAQLMAGALDSMSRLTVDYTAERRQFGQPVARFQAVQAHLVHGAQDAALALMAAEVAAGRASRAGDPDPAPSAGDGAVERAWFEIACARVVAGEAAVSATRAAHQAHGAMGMTREYPLHHLSRRLWAWSRQWGPTSAWRAELAGAAQQAGADGLYPLITDGTAALAGR